ncbi:MAG TPA: cytidine deaminase [Acholeplasmataceae bacterium]|nr:cytidine deaminase [Acholeplasmataceae bacterium]
MKRTNYITWDEYFMGVASLSSKRSKDPNTQVGACIVNNDKRIVGIGYNGLPHGIDDNTFSWDNNDSSDILNSKYGYVVHAEANAILNSTANLKGSTIYVTLFPCNECSKLIVQSGIKEIVYVSNKYSDTLGHKTSIKILDAAGIKYRQMEFGVLNYDKVSK